MSPPQGKGLRQQLDSDFHYGFATLKLKEHLLSFRSSLCNFTEPYQQPYEIIVVICLCFRNKETEAEGH
jgi:hypothetical protein